MKLTAIYAIGICGGIAIAFCERLPPSRPTRSAPLGLHRTVAGKIPIVHLGDASDRDTAHDVSSTQKAITVTQNRPKAAIESMAESRLRDKIKLMEQGAEFLQSMTDYTATLRKQEVVRNQLLDEQIISIKCRHSPFSVYLLWLAADAGREVLYVEGQNNGNLIAHDGGWKSRIPAFTLSIDGPLAMRDTRYPVTTAGIFGLITTMIGDHRENLLRSNVESCKLDSNRQFDGRPCSMFTTTYKSAEKSPVYRKSITLIDNEWKVPLHSEHYEWPGSGSALAENELDPATLIESYSFTEIKWKANLTEHDFDRTNHEYHFR